MKKIILIVIGTLLFNIYMASQQKEATISFAEEDYNYGNIKEEDGPIAHSFEFTNTGSLPLVIYEVKPSCGCTTPNWSKEPIKPGEKGYIEVTFDPKRRPGKFNKSISVNSNDPEGIVVLRIKGNVIPKEKTVEDIYPYLTGGLRFKSNHFSLNQVLINEIKTENFEVLNVSSEPIQIGFKNLPKHLKINVVPEKIDPNEQGNIQITYDPKLKDDWGFVIDNIYMLQNGKEVNNNKFTVSARIEEDFSHLTEEELANAPLIKFDNMEYDFGTINQQTKVEYNFVFKNTGKSDLIIRKIKPSCGCTAVEPKEKIIPPGKSSSIKAIFSAGSRQGNQNKSISVYSNDPKNSKVVIKLKGNVQSNAQSN
ncbi:MAG: DUF1573 domain-containing protein [Bacteroidales bacterium]|nr:DUF1573 domain-containing protein [Bacteroidales bacterium]